MRKVKTSWSKCSVCSIILSDRFIGRHERDHVVIESGNTTADNAGSFSGCDINLPHEKSYSCKAGVPSEYGFFHQGCLHALILSTKIDPEPKIPSTMRGQIAFLSLGTMRVGNIAIGDPIIINDRFCLMAWPHTSIPDCHIRIADNSTETSLTAGHICVIKCHRRIHLAEQIEIQLNSGKKNLPVSMESTELSRYIKRQLNGRFISPQQNIHITYFGKPLSLCVIDITSSQTVIEAERLCNDLNQLNISASPQPNEGENCNITSTPVRSNTTSKVSHNISSSFINGIECPRGALLHGPSGCGKTLMAKEVGRKLSGYAQFITLDATQIWNKQFGESEDRIHKVFLQAIERAPAVVFIDDIDIMCPRRERSQSDLEKRVLASLVSEIDKLVQMPGCLVFVLATTNRLDAVDMNLRRPGRIDREIEVPAPSSVQRAEIISSLTSNMLHNLTKEQITDIASDCHGYVGADLQNLCREAALEAMTQGSPSGLGVSHFTLARSVVQPSAMREIYVDIPRVRWTDIGGQRDLKEKLTQAVIWPLVHRPKFKRLGIKPPRGVLMYGPPGCSKTMIAKALATETSLNFISIKGPELFSKWVGESEKAIRDVFRKARNAAPSIIFFDEIDAVAVERGRQQSGGGGVGDRVLAQLLTELDGVEGLENVNIVAATNRPDMIDKALMRPGRLDRLVYVPLPDENTRDEIFRLRLASVPLAEDVKFSELVKLSHGYSGAEVTGICNESSLTAMQEDIDTEFLEMRHFLAAFECVKPQTSSQTILYYETFASASNKS